MSFSSITNEYRVKVTGLSSDVTNVELSYHFELPSDRITVPKSSKHCAFIHGFESKRQALDFVSKWNKTFKHEHIPLKCEIEDNENENSDSLEENNQSKKQTPCRHGDDCYTANCPYKHSSHWRPCKHGARCTNINCTAIHPPSRKGRCRYGSECSMQNCVYLHPNRQPSSSSEEEEEEEKEGESFQDFHVTKANKQVPREQNLKQWEERIEERKRTPLPIFMACYEFCERILKQKLLVVIAETGSGKSTQIPQYAAECYPDGLVVCTQPRAIAAITLARRVAEEFDGTSVGNSVGYQIGFDHNQAIDCVIGKNIMFMTDAALIHQFQMDSNLSRINVLIIDEAHERSLNTDIVLGMAKLVLQKRSDFHVVILLPPCSSKLFTKFFDHSSSKTVLSLENRLHPVKVINIPLMKDCPDHKFIESHVIPTLRRSYSEQTKHTLVFLSSQREIEKAIQLFTSGIPKGCSVFPLYGSLSPEEHERILQFERRNSNDRMVIFCTNIAETSFPIRNIQTVIDAGLVRQFRFDETDRINISETVRISQFSADQRRDLAGGTRKGVCIRLYNNDELTNPEIEPEILRSSLDLALLLLKRSHLDSQRFPFLCEPNHESIKTALHDLQDLECLDADTRITRRGELFAKLCISPRLSAFMVNIYTEHRNEQKLLTLVATIVAILSAPGSFFSIGDTNINHNETVEYSSDLLYLVHVFNEWKNNGTIHRSTNKCTKCQKVPKDQSEICQSCRKHYAFTNGLNNQILQLIENSMKFYKKTIMDPHWKLQASKVTTSNHSNEEEIIGEHLRKYFPAQLGHLLVPHLPDEGVRLIQSDLRANIANRSVFVQHTHDTAHQFFIAMSLSRLPSGKYVLDRLHRVSAHHLSALPIQQILVRENIGWSLSNEIRTVLLGNRSETWSKWLVHEYDRISCQLIVWGLATDKSSVESALQPILSDTHSTLVECGLIKATFQNGLICSAVQITEKTLRLDLQAIPCRTYAKLLSWLKAKLNISGHDIKENNFREGPSTSSSDDDDDDDYEAQPFYIVLKSVDAYERATAKLPAHHICAQGTLSASTTGTHMNERYAWGRQLVLTVPAGGTFISAKELLDRFTPHAVDCRQFGKRSIRAQPGIELTNLARDIDEATMRQVLQPINPIKISLRQTHRNGTGSATAHIFFANNQQRQQAITNLQASYCKTPITITVRSRTTHQLVQKQVVPTVTELKGIDPIPLTFLITATNCQSANQLYNDIIPKVDSSWNIEGTATVTVAHPHLYLDLDTLIQQIATKFEVQVQQQPIDQKQVNGRGPIRCFFNQGSPQKTAAAATMLAQSTSPIIIKINDERQRQLFDELFTTGIIQDWSNKLKLEVFKKDRSSVTSIEIRGPQVQQGELMRQIGDYSDKFDQRFRILELNSRIANFFGRNRIADKQLQTLADEWSNWGCFVKYVSKTKSIIIYAQPSSQVSLLESCEEGVKKILNTLSTDGNIIRARQKCVFCQKLSYSTNTLRLCGHSYCRCAATHLVNTLPLQCAEPTCKMNIDMADVRDIFPEREDFLGLCKKAVQLYFNANASTYDQRLCPNPVCDGLVKHSSGYQICLTCGRNVCSSCNLVDDDSHQGRTCAERIMFQNMGEFLPNLFKGAEKFARDNWLPATPPIIRVDYNMALGTPCESMKRFNKAIEILGHSTPLDMAKGFFAFHGTAATAIKPICENGFDPKKRAGQACGPGEYFGVTSAVSHGYCRPANPQGPYAMIIGYLLTCPQLTTRPGFCYVMNNPTDWSYAYNVPVVVVSYGTQTSCESPLK